MKTLSIIFDAMGVFASCGYAIFAVMEGHYEAAFWAFAAGIWALNALVRDL